MSSATSESSIAPGGKSFTRRAPATFLHHTRRWTGHHAQLYDISLEDLVIHISANEPVVDEWSRDTITLAGTDFHRLRNEIARRRRSG